MLFTDPARSARFTLLTFLCRSLKDQLAFPVAVEAGLFFLSEKIARLTRTGRTTKTAVDGILPGKNGATFFPRTLFCPVVESLSTRPTIPPNPSKILILGTKRGRSGQLNFPLRVATSGEKNQGGDQGSFHHILQSWSQ